MLGHDYPWPIVASHPHRWHPLLSSCSAQQKEQPSLKKVAAHRVFSWNLPGISWGSGKNGGISSMASQKQKNINGHSKIIELNGILYINFQKAMFDECTVYCIYAYIYIYVDS